MTYYDIELLIDLYVERLPQEPYRRYRWPRAFWRVRREVATESGVIGGSYLDRLNGDFWAAKLRPMNLLFR